VSGRSEVASAQGLDLVHVNGAIADRGDQERRQILCELQEPDGLDRRSEIRSGIAHEDDPRPTLGRATVTDDDLEFVTNVLRTEVMHLRVELR